MDNTSEKVGEIETSQLHPHPTGDDCAPVNYNNVLRTDCASEEHKEFKLSSSRDIELQELDLELNAHEIIRCKDLIPDSPTTITSSNPVGRVHSPQVFLNQPNSNLRNRQSSSSPTLLLIPNSNGASILNNSQINIPMSQTFTAELDPLSLTGIIKTEDELQEMEKSGASKKLLRFYKDQNGLIEELTAPLTSMDEEDMRRQNIKLKIAVYGSAGVNVLLFGLQLTAALLSGSLSLFATTADAFMDLLSSAILLITTYLAEKKEVYRYPAGKGRFETAGIIVFASLMATLSLQLIIKAIQSLTGDPEMPDLGVMSITFVLVALVAKLGLFLYCRLLINQPAAKVLAQDHRNDLFVNSFGLTLGILGCKVNALIDPIGAIVVALIILWSWSFTVMEQCQLIVGKSADPTFLKKVIYIAMTHDERILQVDTCRVYHAGSKVITEVDIVLPPETSLQISHDVGETLQTKLESLPNVDRAFVHCDYEATHTPEHQKWV